MNPHATSILSQRGYSIAKSELTAKELRKFRQTLTIIPHVENEKYAFGIEPISIYKETPKRFYAPRFWGVQKFGPPNLDKLTTWISWTPEQHHDFPLKFRAKIQTLLLILNRMKIFFPKDLLGYLIQFIPRFGSNIVLRPYQVPVIKRIILPHLRKNFGGVLSVFCAYGKCLGKGTKIRMYDGTLKKVEDIKVNDELMGDDCSPRIVSSLARGREQMYKIHQKQGEPYTVNESHILSLKCSSSYSKIYLKGKIYEMSVKDYLNLPKTFRGPGGALLGYKIGVEYPTKNVKISPYAMGIWLGDGSKYGAQITNIDSEILNYFKIYIKVLNDIHGSELKFKQRKHDKISYGITQGKARNKGNPFMSALRYYNLIQNKHIPHDYKINSRKNRMKLLAGLIDSDGYCAGNCCYEITQKREILAKDIVELVRSLGFTSHYKQVRKRCTNATHGDGWGTYYLISVYGNGLENLPVLLQRKKCGIRTQIKDNMVTRITIEKLKVDDYYGFTLDGNHRFLLADFTVTHNTLSSLWISAELGVKTLVVCHITSMMQQWIDNIKKWMPDVRIGIVQQNTCDIDDKDIVIVSLKTAALKEFSKTTFASFGFCIWDEIHLMATQLFSQAFQKLSVKYTLGLSATPYRKDRCDIIFQHFIGPVIYMAEREPNSKVTVKCITLIPPKPIETMYNYRHDIQYTKMLTKLCYNKERCICIARDIVPYAREGRKILVLSDYIKHLKMLQKFIEHEKRKSDTFTTGLYIGEMKMAARLESQKANIILGTYKLASVGMDIPDLDTEAMASPHKEIKQANGRIMRKDTRFPKLILDYTDDHGIFQRQGLVRKKYYRINGFTVELIRMDYKGNIISKRKAPKRKNQKPYKKSKFIKCDAPDIHAKAIKNGEMCKVCKQGTKKPLFIDE